jgi:hypothetical protein
VCRHRAYAFVVTALGMGIASRMVVNEAHAWVEVFDGSAWRRIDLGGAASHIEQDPTDLRAPHPSPVDPFPWPSVVDSGDSVERRDRQAAQPGPRGTSPNSAPASSNSTARDWSTPAGVNSEGNGTSARSSSAPESSVLIGSNDSSVMRGAPLRVAGSVATLAGPCAHVRVDVTLLDARAATQVVVGSLSTNDDGTFSGAVVVPLEMAVGDYELVVATPGDRGCGVGRSSP